MAELLPQLLDMGFPEIRARKALVATNNAGLEQAMDWLISHEGDASADVPDEASESAAPADENGTLMDTDSKPAEGSQVAAASEVKIEVETARSLKCNDCGKLFKSEDEVQFHAAKTQHTNFEESTEEVIPLTAEEKKAKMEALQKRIAERRAVEAEEERKKSVAMEKQRRLQGKDISHAREKFHDDEMMKAAAERRNQKKEDLLIKQRVLDQIKFDREAKKKELQPNDGSSGDLGTASKPSVVDVPPPKRDYNECKLQVRLSDGSTLTHAFQAEESLAAVRLYVELNRKDLVPVADVPTPPFALMTNFPKKVFSEEEMGASLKSLGLVPSAVLIVTKPK